MSTPKAPVHIRPATPDDAQEIYQCIYDLAVFEKLEHEVRTTPEKVHEQLFGADPVAQAVVAETTIDGKTVRAAVAIFFRNFSTFECLPGLYLEDLYVKPEWRGQGIGKAILKHLAGIAVERGYARFEWCVLDWNQPAIDVYRAAGAMILEEWHICRTTGEALQKLAAK